MLFIGFEVSEDAKEFLSGIKEKVAVVSVAGKYRTGKSFLLNRVLLKLKNKGFGVGHTINACTKVRNIHESECIYRDYGCGIDQL